MKLSKILPRNKWYTLVLCCVLVGAVVFLTGPIQTMIADYNTTLRGAPIVKKDGKRLLLAKGNPSSDSAEWFDVTDALVNPRQFNHGIGKDRIPSIDAPEFTTMDDPDIDFQKMRISNTTNVIGVEIDGEARAYPIGTMSKHELVNDTFGEAHVTVAWWPLASLAVVYSREHEGKEVHFGTSGFTMKNVFVLFDRETESIWYPGEDGALEAVGGPRKGDSIPAVVHPEVVKLGDWLVKHPDSKILLPAPHSKTVHHLRYLEKQSREQQPPEGEVAPAATPL